MTRHLTLIAALILASACGGGSGDGSPGGATAKIQILEPTGTPCSGLVFTYSDPGGQQHTVTADAAGRVGVSLGDSGSYFLNSVQYGTNHYGPGSLLLGTMTPTLADSDAVLDYFVVYIVQKQMLQVLGPITEGEGGLLTSASAVGSWTLNFQWPGRNPGVLKLNSTSDGAFAVPPGQPGIGSSDSYGSWTLDNGGNEITFVLAKHQVWVGKVMADGSVGGAMVDTNGTVGSFTGTRH